MIKQIAFKNKLGLVLRGTVAVPKKFDTAVLFLHGFPSSSRGFTAKRLRRDLPRRGFLVMTFDFSHTPVSDGKFTDKLISREVDDTRCAMDFLVKEFKPKRIVLMGHSTGAIVATLYAYRDKRIHKVVLTGAIAELKNAVRYDFSDSDVRDFWLKGYKIYKRPGHWVHGKKLSKRYYDEFFKLDTARAIKKLRRSLMVIHGEKDVIPYDTEGHRLYELANRPKKFVLVKGADHSFSVPVHWKKVVGLIHSFIEK